MTQSPAESASSHLHVESAPTHGPESPLSHCPVPPQDSDSELKTQFAELTRQLEAATALASAKFADLKSAHVELASKLGRSESVKAAMRTELAVLSQQAAGDTAAVTQHVQALTSEHEVLMQRDNNLYAEPAPEPDQFAGAQPTALV